MFDFIIYHLKMYVNSPVIVVADFILVSSIVITVIGIFILRRRLNKLEVSIKNLEKRG
jgi:hypothetical protein